MDDFFIMKVTQCFEYLKHKEAGLILRESSFPFDEVIERLNYQVGYLVGTQFEQDVDVEVVLEMMPEFDDVGMVQFLMDFDLAH